MGITAECLIDSIDAVVSDSLFGSGLSKEWVGLILIPVVGKAAEAVTTIAVSVEDKVQMSLSVAVGAGVVRLPVRFLMSFR